MQVTADVHREDPNEEPQEAFMSGTQEAGLAATATQKPEAELHKTWAQEVDEAYPVSDECLEYFGLHLQIDLNTVLDEDPDEHFEITDNSSSVFMDPNESKTSWTGVAEKMQPAQGILRQPRQQKLSPMVHHFLPSIKEEDETVSESVNINFRDKWTPVKDMRRKERKNQKVMMSQLNDSQKRSSLPHEHSFSHWDNGFKQSHESFSHGRGFSNQGQKSSNRRRRFFNQDHGL